jgi:hypothetical protein
MGNKIDTIKKTAISTCVGAVVLAAGGTIGIATVGFSSVGPVAGSLAASWMSSIATTNGVGVVSSGVYATIQSMAMTGAIVKTCGIVGGIAGAGISILPRILRKNKK